MINTTWKIMFFWFFGTLTVFYHSTFTPKHSKEQCHPLNKRVIILYLLQRQYKNRFQPNEWQSKWKEYTECLVTDGPHGTFQPKSIQRVDQLLSNFCCALACCCAPEHRKKPKWSRHKFHACRHKRYSTWQQPICYGIIMAKVDLGHQKVGV